ncbi:hypothetical protein E4O82_11935, partial [Neisseria meningitidis]|nr:hypothetical protein [Neisseria meningitidis]
MRSGLFFLSGGGCRHIKTGGRCRLKLRHSRHFSSFPRKRESRTFKFSDGGGFAFEVQLSLTEKGQYAVAYGLSCKKDCHELHA